MKLLLANEADCRFFKFWHGDRVCNGINYQGEMFLQFHSFSVRRRDQAYEVGSKLLDRGISVLISCSQQEYILGVSLRGNWWKGNEPENQRLLQEIQNLEAALVVRQAQDEG
ncbi:MAG: hypothetical protein HC780_27530 [Leptolyngbyaceae cyanobacterium CSU_1_3]|nr:hypothetical protein [Leptolyngbyaceae cyanobacterium CSU_1_3]